MPRAKKSSLIDFQAASASADEKILAVENGEVDGDETEAEETKKKNEFKVVAENEYGQLVQSTYKIKVVDKETLVNAKGEPDPKGKPKVIYENDEEPFQHQRILYFPKLVEYYGDVKLTEEQEKLFEQAFSDADPERSKKIGQANADLLKLANDKIKADAKGVEYQRLYNKHAPMDEKQKLQVVAKTIDSILKMNPNFTPEVVINMLKTGNSIPEDYTMKRYLETPRRGE